ncbi:MAG: cytochrome c oxidase subunit II [Kineosporiaceae bacterium]
MDPSVDSSPSRRRRTRLAAGAATVAASLILSGCSAEQLERGYLPADSVGATDMTGRITDLWVGSWVAALLLGLLVWGLTLWVVVAYRRRRADAPLPSQFRYHVPLEVMYTAVPTVIVLVLFYFTARDQSAILALDEERPADLTVEVVGKQWAWDFNYLDYDVYSTGRQADLQAPGDPMERIPTLYLPVDRSVEFVLTTRDVNHSFWVPAFLFKMDLIAGRENRFEVTPTAVGTFEGRCAELCGEYHAEMLFTVEVLPTDEFEARMAELEDAGQTGSLDTNLGRSDVDPDDPDARGGGVRGTGGVGSDSQPNGETGTGTDEEE